MTNQGISQLVYAAGTHFTESLTSGCRNVLVGSLARLSFQVVARYNHDRADASSEPYETSQFEYEAFAPPPRGEVAVDQQRLN